MPIAIKKDILAIFNNHSNKIIFFNTRLKSLINNCKIEPIYPKSRNNILFSELGDYLYCWGDSGGIDGGIEKYDVKSGKLLWSVIVNQPNDEIIFNYSYKNIYIAAIDKIIVIKKNTGEVVREIDWNNKSARWVLSLLGVSKEEKFIYVYDSNGIGEINLDTNEQKYMKAIEGGASICWYTSDNKIMSFKCKFDDSNQFECTVIENKNYIFNINNAFKAKQINDYVLFHYEGRWDNPVNLLLYDIKNNIPVRDYSSQNFEFDFHDSTIDTENNIVYTEDEIGTIDSFSFSNSQSINRIKIEVEKKKHYSIFLSHSSIDKDKVRDIVRYLKKWNIPIWFDEAEIKIGDSLQSKISDGISNSDYLGVVLTKNSVDSKWVKEELEIAINTQINNQKVKVLPILLEDCEIPAFLSTKLYANCTEKNYYMGVKEIEKRLRKEINRTEELFIKI